MTTLHQLKNNWNTPYKHIVFVFCWTKIDYTDVMQKNILITGKPHSGKSTLLKKLITTIENKVGFVTNEILGANGRVGFEIENNRGEKILLAHTDSETSYKVSRYFVNIENLESSISKITTFENTDLLYLDEIGQMQLSSDKFKEMTLDLLNSKNTFLATLSLVFEDAFIKMIKERDDIILIEISAENREEKEKYILQLLRKIEKAKRYVEEVERFKVKDSNTILLHSEHALRNLSLQNEKWHCLCDFFKEHSICSHTIAVQEFIKINKKIPV